MEKEIPYEDIEIGEEMPAMLPKKCKVTSMQIIDVIVREGKDKGKEIGKKLVMKVKHPDSNVELEISKVKYEKANKLAESGLWVMKDKDGKLPFKSATASMLRYYMARTVKEMEGKDIETATDDQGYLLVKAY